MWECAIRVISNAQRHLPGNRASDNIEGHNKRRWFNWAAASWWRAWRTREVLLAVNDNGDCPEWQTPAAANLVWPLRLLHSKLRRLVAAVPTHDTQLLQHHVKRRRLEWVRRMGDLIPVVALPC